MDDTAPTPPPIPARVLAASVARLDLRQLVPLVPGLAYGADLDGVRRDFASWVAAARRPYSSWQEAWNHYIGPAATLRHTPARCTQCRGRGFDLRSAARTGSALCSACRGSRRGSPLTLRARPARLPH